MTPDDFFASVTQRQIASSTAIAAILGENVRPLTRQEAQRLAAGKSYFVSPRHLWHFHHRREGKVCAEPGCCVRIDLRATRCSEHSRLHRRKEYHRVCVECGTEYTVLGYNKRARKTCSDSCAHAIAGRAARAAKKGAASCN